MARSSWKVVQAGAGGDRKQLPSSARPPHQVLAPHWAESGEGGAIRSELAAEKAELGRFDRPWERRAPLASTERFQTAQEMGLCA